MRDVLKLELTVKETLDKLGKLPDPPVDQFSALQELGGMQWQPGSDIGEYFFSVKRKAFYAKMGIQNIRIT